MIYIAYIIHLSFFTLVAIFLGIFSQTTIQLLLVVVIIVFFQGLILIAIGNSIIGSYLMIIYIGAIVILFAFCILFINSKEFESNNTKNAEISQLEIKGSNNNNIIKITYFIGILVIWEIIANIYSWLTIKSTVNSFYAILTESNYIGLFSIELYSILILPLFLMILILLLGLILTIKIIKNR